MAQTMIQKILARASGKETVDVGDKVWADVDLTAMRDFGGPNVILEYEKQFSDRPVHDPGKVAITFDLHVPPRQIKEATNQKLCRDWAAKQGVRLFEVNSGIGQHSLYEAGLVRPWDVIIGTDSHMNLLGALGAFASGVGTTDIVAAMGTGKLWFKVPETMLLTIEGELPKYSTPKDILLHMVADVGADGALYRSVEFDGPTVEKMDLAGRITLCTMVTEMSGKTSIISPSDAVLDEVRRRAGGDTGIEPVEADTDAEYVDRRAYNVDGLEPQVAVPHAPDNVKPITEVAGAAIHQSFIGSCTNGRIEDLRAAAEVLEGRVVDPGVRLIITPGTAEVAKQVVAEGLMTTFLEAGAVVTNPSCALCTIGHPGVLADGDVTLSTSNRNFPGKIGKGGHIYLVSPYVAAASAVAGKLADPREVMA